MPGYIRLCLDTWKVPCTVLNYDNVNDYTDLPLDKLKRFTLPQIADCVRVHVLSDGTPLQYSYLENPMDGGAW